MAHKESLVITPPNIIGDRTKKGSLAVDGRPIVPLVLDSRIVHWDGFTTMLALTELRSHANYHKIPKDRFRAYNRQIQLAAKKENAGTMRRVVRQFSDCVIQGDEVARLTDEMLIEAARYMTDGI